MGIDRQNSEWINTVLKKGTIADRLAAHTLLIHESKNWSSLDTLIEMVDPKKCRRQCVVAMGTLRELFLESLNLSRKNSTISLEEDKKKVRYYYTKFIDRLSLVAFDNLDETRRKAIWTLSELLMKHSENKEYILEKLVEKVGDPVPQLASTAGYLVEKAVNSSKNDLRVKAIEHIQRFLKRSHRSPRARYYAIALLTRIKLVKGNSKIANDLVSTYLKLYIDLYKENELESRLMNAIIVGIHRAYPYSNLKNEVFEQHLQTLYKLIHNVNFQMRVVAMTLIKNIVTKRAQLLKTPIEDRFYNLIFGQLIEPSLQYSSKQKAFVDLLLDVINGDPVSYRKEAFVKRTLQVALNSQPELARLLLSIIEKIKGYKIDLSVNGHSNDDEEDGLEGTSWVHKRPEHSQECDLLARNPRRAVPTHYHEFYLLRQHCDAEVCKYAQQITSGTASA